MQTNYVLIDYENVQPADLSALEDEHFKVIVFVGAKQSKVNSDFAAQLQRLGSNATYVRISGDGSNALDFHIAYYIGQLAAEAPDTYFHIISKDTGFDPLIDHLKSKNIAARRSRSIGDVRLVKSANSQSPSERLAAILANLKQRGASKPRTVTKLRGTISSLFQKAITDTELTALLEQMKKQGLIAITGTKVEYSLPE